MDPDEPCYPAPANVGDTITVKGFAYTNLHGGTDVVERVAAVKLTKSWWDYECGWRFHAELVSSGHLRPSVGTKVYVSEFDISP